MRLDLNFASGRLGSELQAVEGQLEFFCREIRAIVQTVGQRVAYDALQLFAPLVIGVDDGGVWRARTGALKEPALGFEIVVEGFVKIDVVAGEIGEDRRGKVAAPNAIEGQSVRTGLHDGVGTAGIANFREKGLQIDGFGRGVRSGNAAHRRVIGDGAKQTRLCAGSFDDGVDQRSCRGLAIGAGDRDQLQCFRRTTEKIGGGYGKGLARLFHLNPFGNASPVSGSRRGAQNGLCAANDGIPSIHISIGGHALNSDEQGARLHLAGVMRNLRNQEFARGRRREQSDSLEQRIQGHSHMFLVLHRVSPERDSRV